jgi:hypothetical protein
MAASLALWLSYGRRRDLSGLPSQIPDYLDAFIDELPLVRDAFDAPEVRTRSGYWYPRGNAFEWHLRAPHPLTRVFVYATSTWWCGERIRDEYRPPLPVAIPFPPGESTNCDGAFLPPMLDAAASSRSVGAHRWSAQPIEKVRRWLDAAGEYVSRQREALAGLGDWAVEAERLDHRKPWHAGRIARAVPAQRRAMERFCEASADYRPVYDEVMAAVRASPDPDPLAEPVTALLKWAKKRMWLVTEDPGGEGMRVYRHDAAPGEVTANSNLPWLRFQGKEHKPADLSELLWKHLTGRPEEGTVAVAWDEASVALCDREIAEFWEGSEEHSLPEDFDAFWRVHYGYDRRSVQARNRVGTVYTPEPYRGSARRRGYSGGGGGDAGFYGGIVAGSGGDSGGSSCGSGCGGGGGGGGCGGG